MQLPFDNSSKCLPILRVHATDFLSAACYCKIRICGFQGAYGLRRYRTLFFGFWRPPALPHRLQWSTIGRMGLNRRVRYGNGCVPHAYRRQIFQGIDPWTVKHIPAFIDLLSSPFALRLRLANRVDALSH